MSADVPVNEHVLSHFPGISFQTQEVRSVARVLISSWFHTLSGPFWVKVDASASCLVAANEVGV